jgi:predicted metal-dependent phosphotriesterase family hydrolase
MTQVQTIRGPVDTSTLGRVLVHEQSRHRRGHFPASSNSDPRDWHIKPYVPVA